jgi:hypothetical protein
LLDGREQLLRFIGREAHRAEAGSRDFYLRTLTSG